MKLTIMIGFDGRALAMVKKGPSRGASSVKSTKMPHCFPIQQKARLIHCELQSSHLKKAPNLVEFEVI